MQLAEQPQRGGEGTRSAEAMLAQHWTLAVSLARDLGSTFLKLCGSCGQLQGPRRGSCPRHSHARFAVRRRDGRGAVAEAAVQHQVIPVHRLQHAILEAARGAAVAPAANARWR